MGLEGSMGVLSGILTVVVFQSCYRGPALNADCGRELFLFVPLFPSATNPKPQTLKLRSLYPTLLNTKPQTLSPSLP